MKKYTNKESVLAALQSGVSFFVTKNRVGKLTAICENNEQVSMNVVKSLLKTGLVIIDAYQLKIVDSMKVVKCYATTQYLSSYDIGVVLDDNFERVLKMAQKQYTDCDFFIADNRVFKRSKNTGTKIIDSELFEKYSQYTDYKEFLTLY